MNNKDYINKILNNYDLDEKEIYFDKDGMLWFTQEFLAKMFDITQAMVLENIKELLNLKEITFDNNIKKFVRIYSGKTMNHYDMNVLYNLGMWVKSPKALEFRKNMCESHHIAIHLGNRRFCKIKNY